jgi:hypothetical protein
MEGMGRTAGMVLVGLLAALSSCEPGDDGGTPQPRAASAPEARPAPAPDHEARAVECMEAEDWECAARELRAAGQPEATRARLVTALAAEAKRREKILKLARPGRDRLVAAQDAAAAWALWSEVSGKPLPASARRVAQAAVREEKAAARQEAKDGRSFVPGRECCKHCTTGCPCGDSCISCAKQCHKGRGCAC